MVVFPYERIDGQQLREGMTDELKGTIDNLQTRLPMRQNNFRFLTGPLHHRLTWHYW